MELWRGTGTLLVVWFVWVLVAMREGRSSYASTRMHTVVDFGVEELAALPVLHALLQLYV